MRSCSNRVIELNPKMLILTRLIMKIKYEKHRMRSCSNRVIELNLKMLILTRFVTKNYFFHVSIKKTDVECL